MRTFTKETIPFLLKAHKQKGPDWIDKHQHTYDDVLRLPFVELAKTFEQRLKAKAPRYHFPTKGIGRIKLPAFKVGPGEPHYKNWLSITAAIPTGSRFERNPHLFFGILPNEEPWHAVIVSAGLYRPSSKQLKRVRQAIADEPEAFHEIFDDRAFKARFKDGPWAEQTSTRVPKGFDPDHPDVGWLKLKNFMVVRKLTIAQFTSAKLADEVVRDFEQGLRLNELLLDVIAD